MLCIASVWLRPWHILRVCLQWSSDAKYLELSQISQVKGIVRLKAASEAHRPPVLLATGHTLGDSTIISDLIVH